MDKYVYRSIDIYDTKDYLFNFHQNSINGLLGAGLKFNLYKNINLTVESSLQLNYSLAVTSYPIGIQNPYYDKYNNRFLFKFNPIRQLGISFNY